MAPAFPVILTWFIPKQMDKAEVRWMEVFFPKGDSRYWNSTEDYSFRVQLWLDAHLKQTFSAPGGTPKILTR